MFIKKNKYFKKKKKKKSSLINIICVLHSPPNISFKIRIDKPSPTLHNIQISLDSFHKLLKQSKP